MNRLSYIHRKIIYTNIYLGAHLTCWHYTSQVIFSWVFSFSWYSFRRYRQTCHRAEVPVESRSANCLEVVDWPSRTRMPRAEPASWVVLEGPASKVSVVIGNKLHSHGHLWKPTYVHFVCRMVRVQTRIDFLLQDIMITSIIGFIVFKYQTKNHQSSRVPKQPLSSVPPLSAPPMTSQRLSGVMGPFRQGRLWESQP